MSSSSISASQRESALSPSQSDKVSFLSVPEHYREPTKHVLVVQTHHAWVFLTDRYAYKMKKPSRYGPLDLSSLDSRRRLCAEEYRLNRRLARRTYIGLIRLVIGHNRGLELDADGKVVEWLVKMRRLPDEHLLNNAAVCGLVSDDDISRLMRKLLRFYRDAPVCQVNGVRYTLRLQNELSRVTQELSRPEFRFPKSLVKNVVDRQRRYIETYRECMERRQYDGKVREIHGDLRPEHICLMPNAEPEIIDCLEFDSDLRCLDCVEELAYLGLECRVIDQQWIEKKITEWYGSNSGDTVPMHLWNFYASRRATVRAMLCGWHTLDTGAINQWTNRGREYLTLALRYLNTASIV